MEWKARYSVGIQEIDDQHRHLLELFSRIDTSVRLHRGWKAIIYELVDLKVFARKHFDLEESLMRMYGFVNCAEHEQSHQHFFARLTEIESRSISDLAQTELIKFLCDWLKNHISGEDKHYAEHILSGAPVVRAKEPRLAAVK